jgi:hypothetical protein
MIATASISTKRSGMMRAGEQTGGVGCQQLTQHRGPCRSDFDARRISNWKNKFSSGPRRNSKRPNRLLFEVLYNALSAGETVSSGLVLSKYSLKLLLNDRRRRFHQT